MTTERWRHDADPPPNTMFDRPEPRTVASYERELTLYRRTELRLRQDLAQKDVLLRQKEELINRHDFSGREFDHRLLNGLQMIASLLLLQSRASASPDAASQLIVAANRVAAIGQVHRRLHCLDGEKTVAFRQFLDDFCRDFSTLLSSDNAIVFAGIDVDLPAARAVPLGFIVNELVTNAVKYGKGGIAVRLQPNPERGYALSVANDGPVLPEGFDPAACAGLGLQLIRSLVREICGELLIGRGDQNQGTQFTVLFS
ncbi:MAG TPA: sensor histidine kinase [Xanthobacteraceae bacterium]